MSTTSPHTTSVPAPSAQPNLRGRDTAALLLLLLGPLLCGVGWIAGAVMLWISDRWERWEKLLGTLLIPGGPLFLMIGGLLAWQTAEVVSCTSTPGAGVTSVLVGDDGQVLSETVEHATDCGSSTQGEGLLWLAAVILPLVISVGMTIYLAKRARPGRESAR